MKIEEAIEAQEAHNDRDGYDDKGYHECKDTDYLVRNNYRLYLHRSVGIDLAEREKTINLQSVR